jgi:hypothetical protein
VENEGQSPLAMDSKWFRLSNCEPKRSDLCWTFNKESPWVVDFSGGRFAKARKPEYEPDYETLYDALDDKKLPLKPGEYKEPTKEAVAFLKKWGPLGFAFMTPERIQVLTGQASLPDYYRAILFETNSIVKRKGRLWDRLTKTNDPPSRIALYDGYSEPWLLIHAVLLNLKRSFTKVKAGDYSGLNKNLGGLEFYLKELDDAASWGFRFSTLADALYALLAQKTIGGAKWEVCLGCGGQFDVNEVKRFKHCSPECMEAFAERRVREIHGNPLEVRKRRLRSALDRRIRIGYIKTAKETEVRDHINDCKNLNDLEVIEEVYDYIFEPEKRGPKPKEKTLQ